MQLRADNLIKKYKSRTVVKGVSVNVEQGEIVGLLGPNGAGKTTTFYMIVGLIKPNEGKIYYNNQEITELPMYKRSQRGIGYLPQEASVFRKLTVEENIKAVLEMQKGMSKAQQAEKLESLISEFGLNHVRKNRGDLLSGGERRRTEIARALASDPKFILLDEPFAGVDPIAVEDIQSIVAKLKEKNIGILITDHNVQETLSITDRAYLLYEGNILKAGVAEDLANDEEVRRVYLGQNFELRKPKLHGSDAGRFLKDLSPLELAFMKKYRYDGFGEASKKAFDNYINDNMLTVEMLQSMVENAEAQGITQHEYHCPRCGTDKLARQQEEKIHTNKYEGLGGATGSAPAMVEKITCNVCGLIISDPNNE